MVLPRLTLPLLVLCIALVTACTSNGPVSSSDAFAASPGDVLVVRHPIDAGASIQDASVSHAPPDATVPHHVVLGAIPPYGPAGSCDGAPGGMCGTYATNVHLTNSPYGHIAPFAGNGDGGYFFPDASPYSGFPGPVPLDSGTTGQLTIARIVPCSTEHQVIFQGDAGQLLCGAVDLASSAAVVGVLPAANVGVIPLDSGTNGRLTLTRIVPCSSEFNIVMEGDGGALICGQVDLSSTAAITGTLSATHQGWQPMGGDITGFTGDAAVTSLQRGVIAISLSNGNLTWVPAASSVTIQQSATDAAVPAPMSLSAQQSIRTNGAGGTIDLSVAPPNGSGAVATVNLGEVGYAQDFVTWTYPGGTQTWANASANPGLAQASTANATPTTMVLAPQQSTAGSNQAGGNVVVGPLGVPTGSGKDGELHVQRTAGSDIFAVGGDYSGTSGGTYTNLCLFGGGGSGNVTSCTDTNVTIQAGSGLVFFNAPSGQTLGFGIGGAGAFSETVAGGINFYAAANATLSQSNTSATTPSPFVIIPPASTAGASANGSSMNVDLTASGASGVDGRFNVQYGSNTLFAVGNGTGVPGFGSTYAVEWLLGGGGTPTGSNYAAYGNTNGNIVNFNAGTELELGVAGIAYLFLESSEVDVRTGYNFSIGGTGVGGDFGGGQQVQGFLVAATIPTSNPNTAGDMIVFASNTTGPNSGLGLNIRGSQGTITIIPE